MKTNRILQSGFSAVELLITLFIAAAFIGTGYQLYSIIIDDGGEARARARASNIAYTALRQYSAQATNPCTVFTPTPTPSIPAGSNLPSNAVMSVAVTCPHGTSTATTKVQVTITYGTPQEEVKHALYVANE